MHQYVRSTRITVVGYAVNYACGLVK